MKHLAPPSLALAAALIACAPRAGLPARVTPPATPAPAPAVARPAAFVAADVVPASDEPAAESPTREGAPRECGDGAWSTYAHDAGRTSASDGCARGPLRESWRFTPRPFQGRLARAHHAVVQRGAVYLQALRGQSPALHRLDESGNERWLFDTRADIHRDDWPTVFQGGVLLNDDGFYWVEPESGVAHGKFLDSWGPSLTDGERVYSTNALEVEGPGLFVGAFDREGRPLWKKNALRVGEMFGDPLGGIALEGGVVIHAAGYKFARYAGVYGLDAVTGATRWSVPDVPLSPPSAAAARVHTIEARPDGDHLVTRGREDGREVWSRPVAGARGAAPVVAAGLVVVHGDAGVLAFDAATGAPRWSAVLPRTPLHPVAFEKTATAKDPVGQATSLAAALGSGTLVVTRGPRVAILRLDDGTVEWSGLFGAPDAEAHSPVVHGEAVYVVVSGSLLRLDRGPVAARPLTPRSVRTGASLPASPSRDRGG